MAETQILRQDPDGSRGLESAAQLIGRVLLPVGDGLMTIPEALADRPTQQDVTRGLAAVLNAAQGATDALNAVQETADALSAVQQTTDALAAAVADLPTEADLVARTTVATDDEARRADGTGLLTPGTAAILSDWRTREVTLETLSPTTSIGAGQDADAAFAAAVQFMGNQGRPVALRDGCTYGLNTAVNLPQVPGCGFVGNGGAKVVGRRSGLNNNRQPNQSGYAPNAANFFRALGSTSDINSPLVAPVLRGFQMSYEPDPTASRDQVRYVSGIQLYNVTDVQIEGLRVSGLPMGAGILGGSVRGGYIRGCQFVDFYIGGHFGNSANSYTGLWAVLLDNDRLVVSGNANAGFSRDIEISGCVAREFIFGPAALAQYGAQTNGFEFQGSIGLRLLGNHCRNVGEAFDLSGARYCIVANNTAEFVATFIKLIHGATDNDVHDNECRHFFVEAISIAGTPVATGNPTTRNKIHHNHALWCIQGIAPASGRFCIHTVNNGGASVPTGNYIEDNILDPRGPDPASVIAPGNGTVTAVTSSPSSYTAANGANYGILRESTGSNDYNRNQVLSPGSSGIEIGNGSGETGMVTPYPFIGVALANAAGLGADNVPTFAGLTLTGAVSSSAVSSQTRYTGLALRNAGTGQGTEINISLTPNNTNPGERDVQLAAIQGVSATATDFVVRTANSDTPVEVLRITAGGGSWLPGLDNVTSLGNSAKRMSTIFAGTGTINSSDLRLKVLRGAFNDAELDAWGEIRWCVFQMADRVAKKGAEEARLHAGLIAQEVEETFARHGLQAANYALWCSDPLTTMQTRTRMVERPKMVTTQVEQTVYVATSDGAVASTVTVDATRQVIEWRDLFSDGEPVTDENGKAIQVQVPMTEMVEESYEVEVPLLDADDAPVTRLGLRYDNAFAFEAAWSRREMTRLQARLEALETRAS